MAGTVFNKSTAPQFDPIADESGRVRTSWLTWFSQRQTFDNSIQHRWVLRFGGGLSAVAGEIVTYAGTENDPLLFPAGSPLRVISDGNNIRGIVNSCVYDSGAGSLTFNVTMDNGATLGTLTGLFYGVLTSSVLP